MGVLGSACTGSAMLWPITNRDMDSRVGKLSLASFQSQMRGNLTLKVSQTTSNLKTFLTLSLKCLGEAQVV